MGAGVVGYAWLGVELLAVVPAIVVAAEFFCKKFVTSLVENMVARWWYFTLYCIAVRECFSFCFFSKLCEKK